MRSSIQVSAALRRRLARRKRHPRESYEEVIDGALRASGAPPPLASGPPLEPRISGALAAVRAALVRLYGARIARLVLYGSVARGEALPGSDVDLLLVLRGEVDRGAEIAHVVEATYDVLLERGVHVSVLPMAEEEFLLRTTPLLVNVRREGIPL